MFDKIRNEVRLSTDDKDCIAKFADLFITCSLKDIRTEQRAKEVQVHHHTRCCRKKNVKCRFFYPKFPTLRTIISVPFYHHDGSEEDQKEKLKFSNLVLKKVSDVLEDEDIMNSLYLVGQKEIDEFNKWPNG